MRCHKMVVKTSSQPVEMEPYSAKVPAQMPLRNSLLTCVTCHDMHSENITDSGEKTCFLRRTSLSLCMSCHSVHPANTDELRYLCQKLCCS